MALGAKEWSVETCIDQFVRLCDQAFTPRELHTIRGLSVLSKFHHGSIYKTRPLHAALKQALGETYLFGGERSHERSYDTRVAVTSTDEIGKKAMIISNYNRPGESRANHEFKRPQHPHREMKVWEAAAATSAAPPYFKAFVHPTSGRGYLDGAVYHNNPIRVVNRERKFVWPDVSEHHPDLLLSLGTGKDQKTKTEVQQIQRSGSNRYLKSFLCIRGPTDMFDRSHEGAANTEAPPRRLKKWKTFPATNQIFRLMVSSPAHSQTHN